jgi:hypothetical protein
VGEFMVQGKGRKKNRKAFDMARDWRQINFLQPVYDELGGNSTVISIGPDKTVKDKRTVKSVLKQLASIFAVDLGRTKKNYGAVVCRRSSAPIPLNSSLVLLPIKMRHSLIKGDGAWGYVVLDKIKNWGAVSENEDENENESGEIEEAVGMQRLESTGEYKSLLDFHDGTRLATMVSQATIYSLIKDGEMARKKYLELLSSNKPAADSVLEARDCYLRNSCQAERVINIIEEWFKKIN